MSEILMKKVVAVLPESLDPNCVYYVRVGDGFDIYVSDATGRIAHKANTSISNQNTLSNLESQLFNDYQTQIAYLENLSLQDRPLDQIEAIRLFKVLLNPILIDKLIQDDTSEFSLLSRLMKNRFRLTEFAFHQYFMSKILVSNKHFVNLILGEDCIDEKTLFLKETSRIKSIFDYSLELLSVYKIVPHQLLLLIQGSSNSRILYLWMQKAFKLCSTSELDSVKFELLYLLFPRLTRNPSNYGFNSNGITPPQISINSEFSGISRNLKESIEKYSISVEELNEFSPSIFASTDIDAMKVRSNFYSYYYF